MLLHLYPEMTATARVSHHDRVKRPDRSEVRWMVPGMVVAVLAVQGVGRLVGFLDGALLPSLIQTSLSMGAVSVAILMFPDTPIPWVQRRHERRQEEIRQRIREQLYGPDARQPPTNHEG